MAVQNRNEVGERLGFDPIALDTEYGVEILWLRCGESYQVLGSIRS
jgi:hypothetical protein